MPIRKTYKGHIPAHLDVRARRTKLKMSQTAFAARFGILPSTLHDWKQNRRNPDGTARGPIDGHRQGIGRSHPRARAGLTPKADSKRCRSLIGVTTQERILVGEVAGGSHRLIATFNHASPPDPH